MTICDRDFWNKRYQECPALGSGPSSRGYVIPYKRGLVRDALVRFDVASILDIGCGDLCWLDDQILRICAYTGVDISEIIVARNRERYPFATFLVRDFSESPLAAAADMVVCFDVLIHQIDRDLFLTGLRNTMACIGTCALVSYRTPPLLDGNIQPPVGCAESTDPQAEACERDFAELRSTIPKLPGMKTAFHGPLDEHVAAIDPCMTATEVGRYRHHTVYLLIRTR